MIISIVFFYLLINIYPVIPLLNSLYIDTENDYVIEYVNNITEKCNNDWCVFNEVRDASHDIEYTNDKGVFDLDINYSMEHGGNCQNRAILMASILKKMDYDVYFLIQRDDGGHICVGVGEYLHTIDCMDMEYTQIYGV
jgi:hypothetical protein